MKYYKLDPEAESIHPLAELFPPVEWWRQPHYRTYALLQIDTPADKPFRGHRKVIDTLKEAVVEAHADRWADSPEIQLQDVRVRLEAIRQIQLAWEARIGPLLEEGASILKAWLQGTGIVVPKIRTPDLYRDSSHFWYRIKHGSPGDGGDGLIRYFDALCDRYLTPPKFAKGQRSELRRLLKLVDELKSEIIIVDDERLAYEEIQNDLIHQSPEPFDGQKLIFRLSSKRGLMEYARILHKDKDMSLPATWERITELVKGKIELRYSNFGSFERSYYEFHPSPAKGEDSSVPE